jgi:hypothetical protein
VDRALDETGDELMRLHAEHCPECAGLASALIKMTEELPLLAELEPDREFLADVMRATMPADRRLARAADAWLAGHRALLKPPRIAWEGAYLGTFLLALVFVAPGSPWSDVSKRVVDWARMNPLEELREPAAEIEVAVASGARTAWRSTGERAIEVTRLAAENTYERIRADLGTLLNRDASKEANATARPNSEQGEEQ